MPVQKHIIRKQTLDVTFEGTIDAFAFKEEIAGFCTKMLLPAIEKVFDEKSIKGKVQKAEKLCIDAGELPAENWQKVFCEKVVEQLLKALASYSEPFSATAAVGEEGRYAQTTIVKNESEQESAVKAVFYFLETGLLPWNATVKDKEGLQYLMEVALGHSTFSTQLLQRSKARPRLPERLIQQFKEPVLEKIMEAIGLSKNLIEETKRLVFSLFDKMLFPAAERKGLLYLAMLKSAFLWQKKHSFSESTDSFEEGVLKAIFENIPKEKLLQLVQKLKSASLKKEVKAKQIAEDQINYRQKVDSAKQAAAAAAAAGKTNFIHNPKEEEYFIWNAGLVLLNPFIAALFENVGYTEKNKWLTDEVQQRALALTQYIVTGQEEYPEFDLLLNKILIGYPLDKTLAGEIVLSEFEKDEARDLLLSVIRHWAALKNTSVEGLQNTFLQREGKVWFRDSNSYLKVAQKTEDILMNKLPWGISIIKTPWMDHMMHVEWN